MKPPSWFAANKPDQHQLGINPFAVELLAESFATRRDGYGEETLCVLGWGKDKKPVYICLSSLPPEGVLPGTEQPNGFFVMHFSLKEKPHAP